MTWCGIEEFLQKKAVFLTFLSYIILVSILCYTNACAPCARKLAKHKQVVRVAYCY